MITLTKEWLLKTIAELEEERDATPGVVNENAAMALAAMKLALASLEAEPAPASVPDDVSGPLAHAYKELTPTFMRNHIDVFERYGIYPDGSAGIQAMRIALDGMNRRAAMLQGAEQTNYRAIVERIAEIIHGKVTDIDLLTVTVKSMKDKLQN
ncbi:hypothetical protein [Enterobacter hormaechei]|uniref:hypothetical protein n=1 Tax=Enterobacter hormaechei TaxID=158836 RepID=UPI00215D44DE|nr:hypothetical protein [Enterobacter hormaechei]